jgi:NAD(P)-dependent dehydrogenase (short-subunit alcohol dehydrogenase family)
MASGTRSAGVSPQPVGPNRRTIVVVGATSGIGREAAIRLGGQGHRVILVGRNQRRGDAVAASITRDSGDRRRAVFIAGDVSTRAGVEAVVAAIRSCTDRVDTLFNNAGVMVPKRRLTDEGIELNFAVHHLAPYSMTGMLLPLLDRGDGRVVNTNSEGHRATLFGGHAVDMDFSDLQSQRDYNIFLAYSRTKLANLLFTYEFQRRFPRYTMVAVHPGMVRTRIARSLRNPALVAASTVGQLFMLSSGQGAKPLVRLADDPDVRNGAYYDRFTPVESSPASRRAESARRLWLESERLRGPFVTDSARA